MLPLLMAAFLSLPLYPLNPTKIDTVKATNLHLSVGLNGPSQIMNAGPEFSAKYEMLFYHPLVARASFDYRFGDVNSEKFPNGSINRGNIAVEMLYYRGTNQLMGFAGMGIVLSLSDFSADEDVKQKLFDEYGYTDINIQSAFGYRLTFGLRIKKAYSIEIGITEIKPRFEYISTLEPGHYVVAREKFRFNDFKISFGYLIDLKI